MNGIRNDLIIKTLAGALIGMVIWIILFLTGGYPDEMVLDRPALAAQLTGSVIFGAVCMGGSVVYGIESMGVTRATLFHFVLCTGSFLIVSHILGWFPASWMPIVLAIFVLAYFIIWLINYIYWINSVKDLNRDLEQMRSSREKGDRE